MDEVGISREAFKAKFAVSLATSRPRLSSGWAVLDLIHDGGLVVSDGV